MDILRNLFGAVTSGIIRLLVAVGILAAAYFFIVKPVLHTTDNAIKEANKSIETSLGGATTTVDVGSRSIKIDGDITNNLQRDLVRAYTKAQKRGQIPQLNRCIQRSGADLQRIRRCAKKFS